MTIRSIRGTLAPANPQEINKLTSGKVRKAVADAGLSELIHPSPAWKHGIIVITNPVTTQITGEQLIERLTRLFRNEDIEILALEGELVFLEGLTSIPKRLVVKPFDQLREGATIEHAPVNFSHFFTPSQFDLATSAARITDSGYLHEQIYSTGR